MKKLDIEKMRKAVEDWVSQPQHTVKYFPVFQILAQLMEELAELDLAINETELSHSRNHDDVKKEVGDVLFVLTCLANSKNLDVQIVADESLSVESEQLICLHMYRKNGDISREIQHTDGFKKKKPSEETNGLPKNIGQMLYLVQELCRVCMFDINECFKLSMQKREIRDKNRFLK